MKEEVKLFLNSDLDEADFFKLPKDNLLSLREYLLKLKDVDTDFQIAINKQLQLIKNKCNWVSTISFNGLIHDKGSSEITSIHLHSNDGIDLVVSKNNFGVYEDLVKNIPRLYLLSGKIRKQLLRQKDLKFIQGELNEIDDIGQNLYRFTLTPITSISNNFIVYSSPAFGTSVYSDFDLIATYEKNYHKKYDRDYLKSPEEKGKMLEKILVKSNIK